MRSESAKVPILIYQMGKVGSSSILEALTALNLSVIHLHTLNQRNIVAAEDRSAKRGLSLPAHIRASKRVRAKLIGHGKPLRIVTAVRDPIARNISAYFQNLNTFRQRKKDFDTAELEGMMKQFVKVYPHDLPLGWFDTEIKEILGVDVYEYPFPQTAGTQIIQQNEIRILILRAETPDETKVRALRAFLDIPEMVIEPKNVGANKDYSEYYNHFLECIRLPNEYINKMYESRYAKHFYTPEEILKFRERWEK